MEYQYLIVGAGAAGLAAAQELRALQPQASLALVNGEDRLPYKRTKLSKFLAQGFERDDFAVHPAAWFSENRIDLLSGLRVNHLDPDRRTAVLSDGQALRFSQVLLALGSVGRNLPAPGLREAAEAEVLRQRWIQESTITILGGGILGVEMAEQAALMGKKVMLFSRTGVLMKSDLTPYASARLKALLESRGILVTVGTSALPEIQAAALGSPPRIDLAKHAGLAFDLGIKVDERFRTSHPAVWAAGDCAQLPGGHVCHLWHEAEAQGQWAARDMAGQGSHWPYVPYREKLEVFGDYYFSMTSDVRSPFREVTFPGIDGGEVYQAWYGSPEKVSGVVMAGDKERTKTYEKAVREGWTWEKIQEGLGG